MLFLLHSSTLENLKNTVTNTIESLHVDFNRNNIRELTNILRPLQENEKHHLILTIQEIKNLSLATPCTDDHIIRLFLALKNFNLEELSHQKTFFSEFLHSFPYMRTSSEVWGMLGFNIDVSQRTLIQLRREFSETENRTPLIIRRFHQLITIPLTDTLPTFDIEQEDNQEALTDQQEAFEKAYFKLLKHSEEARMYFAQINALSKEDLEERFQWMCSMLHLWIRKKPSTFRLETAKRALKLLEGDPTIEYHRSNNTLFTNIKICSH